METEILPRQSDKHLWIHAEMLEKLPETNELTELWNGELVASVSPGVSHRGAPDLIVEVATDRTWRLDRIFKKELYGQFEVKEYWIIDPEAQSVEILFMTTQGYKWQAKARGDERANSKLLPGLSVSFREVEL